MSLAPVQFDLSYWQKAEKPLFTELSWNIPERKTGRIAVVGGNAQSFATPIKISEYLSQTLPFETVATLLPDSLRTKLPPLPNFTFFPSTASGSFAKSLELRRALTDIDATLLIGDLSRNAATAVALADALIKNEHLLVLARDSLDLLATETDAWINRANVIVVASLLQLQKLFRAIYYPRMIMLSQPLVPTLETLHKFTLSYPITLLTLHENQIIVASNGKIITTPLQKTTYTPLSLWSGKLASNILALNFYNPQKYLEATVSALTF